MTMSGRRPCWRFALSHLPRGHPAAQHAGIASGSLLVFLTALGFFITPALLGSPQELMIATLVSQQIREVLDWPFASALVGVLTLFVTILALVFSKTLRFDRLMGAQS